MRDDLAAFLAGCPADIPVTVMGAGSNLLVRDGGVAGVVVKMNAHLTSIHHEGTQIIAKTGATDADVARYAQKAGISGLEFLIGIPGTIGGGLRMNAGAYGSEFKDVTCTQPALTGRAIQFQQPQQIWAWHTDIVTPQLTGFLQQRY